MTPAPSIPPKELPGPPASSGPGSESIRPPWRRHLEKAKYIGLGLFFIALPILSLTVFYIGVFHRGAADPWMLWLITAILFCVMIVPTSMVLMDIFQLYRAKVSNRLDAHPRHDHLVELTVHAVPYGILALSMLFEYHKFATGEVEGMAALASIMILFILAELGLFLFENIKSARVVSGKLDATLVNANESLAKISRELHALPWVKSYIELAGTESEPLTDKMKALFDVYTKLLKDGSERTPSLSLMRVFLHRYISEELDDIEGNLDIDSIPPPLRFIHRGSGVSFFATNVGFYGSFLQDAVNYLASIGTHGDQEVAPCIAVITNALPSQFWNWPRENGFAEEYSPVAAYRDAQFEGVRNKRLKVFRVILVGEAPKSGTHTLRSPSEHNEQLEWSFLFKDTDIKKAHDDKILVSHPAQPIRSDDVAYPARGTGILIDSILSWNDGLRTNKESKRVCWITSGRDGESPASYVFYPVWEYYCRSMHGVDCDMGRTDVFSVIPDCFNNEFKSCPDVMFLGTCPTPTQDIWQNDTPEWNLALVSTMSTQTETMFLGVVHEREEIKKLWSLFRTARRSLNDATKGTRLSSSTDLR